MFSAHALALGWGGIPVIWSGDELAMVNDPDWAAEPGHGSDNRWAHRPRLTDADLARRTDLSTVAGRMFAGLRALIQARAGCRTWTPRSAARSRHWPTRASCRCCAAIRSARCWGCYNVTDSWRPFPRWRLDELLIADPWDALSNAAVQAGEDGNVWLAPYQAMWIV